MYVHSKYAITTTSATTALHTSLECMNARGKKVLVSDFTFPATALAVILAGTAVLKIYRVGRVNQKQCNCSDKR